MRPFAQSPREHGTWNFSRLYWANESFGTKFPAPPPQLTDPYEISNWRDCRMTAALWTRWQRDELMSYV